MASRCRGRARRRAARSGRATPRQQLVDVAEVALQEPDERDLAAIEVGEVDAGAENAPAAIFRMLDRAAADDGDVGRAVEDARRRRRSPSASSVVSSSALRKRGLRASDAPPSPALEPRRAEIEHAVARRISSAKLARSPAAAAAWRGRGESRRAHPRARARGRCPGRPRRRPCRAVERASARDLLARRHQPGDRASRRKDSSSRRTKREPLPVRRRRRSAWAARKRSRDCLRRQDRRRRGRLVGVRRGFAGSRRISVSAPSQNVP